MMLKTRFIREICSGGIEYEAICFDEQEQMYVAEILMKQGYYNYLYLFVPDGSSEGSTIEAEGSFYQTENEYTIFVYARLQGERYDRLLGYRDFRFVPNK